MAWRERLGRVVAATAAKVLEQERLDGADCGCRMVCTCAPPDGPLNREYAELEQVGPAWSAGAQHEAMVEQGLCRAANRHKDENRYSNLFPYDASRVVLRGQENDYINASWVAVEGVPGRLVLAMGPLHPDWHGEDTVGQFWHMVGQEDVRLVVMLCEVQAGYSGCSAYYPTPQHPGLGGGVESLGQEGGQEGRVVTRLRQGDREVTHMQFTKWPNYGVAESVAELAEFVRSVVTEEELQEGSPPVVVHCSGGVGRSGTFAAVYSLYRLVLGAVGEGSDPAGWAHLERHLAAGAVTLVPVVTQLRETRHPWMVEGEHQYCLAYRVLLRLLEDLVLDLDQE